MIGYAVLRWNPESIAANAAVASLAGSLPSQGLCKVAEAPGWVIVADPGAADCVRSLTDPTRLVIGQVFDRRATDQSRHGSGRIDRASGDFAALCQFLVQHCWGSYIAFEIDPGAPDRLAMFRDPIGMHEALTWVSADGVRVVTSRPEALIPLAPPVNFGIDWDRAAQLLQFAGSAGESVPLTGIDTVPTGSILRCGHGRSLGTRLWSPASFARERGNWTRPPEECLPDLVDACIGAWASTTSTAIAELSGGLDSAIVAAGLVRAAGRPTRRWFHYYGPDAPGDERTYARAVGQMLDLPFEELRATDSLIDARLVDAIPLGARPSVASLSLLHHADMAARGAALGATALFTGQGGDALFYQAATPMIACELWKSAPPGRTRLGALAALARWSGGSIWSTLRKAIGASRQCVTPPGFPFALVRPERICAAPEFDWLDDTADLPPAKQLQILLLAMCRAAFAPSWTTQQMTTVHPLFSQPLVERLLGLSALELTHATRDRALIRSAYARRLPPALIARPSKGRVSAAYGRMLASSLPFLRDYLMNGMLVANHVLDRAALEHALDVDILMERNIYAEIYAAIFMERWVRGWSGELPTGRAMSA